MTDDTGNPKRGDDLAAYVERARESGAVRIDTDDAEVFVVAPRQRTTGVPAPFDDADSLLEPPLKRSAYSDRTAWLMASLSALAYLPFETDVDVRADLAAKLGDAGLVFESFFDDSGTGTQCYLARRPGEFTVLVFRGTEKDRKDILADLNARFYKTADGKAHRGFAMAYEGVRKSVVSALEELREKGELDRLFIAGHSLGGALATVAARDLEGEFLVAGCYTFGSPRVGDAEWSDAVKTPVYRVVNGADGVPLVPMSAFVRKLLLGIPYLPLLGRLEGPIEKLVKRGFVGFQHAGDLRFLHGRPDTVSLKIGSAAAGARLKYITIGLFGRLMEKLRLKALSSVFADHSISGYRLKLRKIAEDRN